MLFLPLEKMITFCNICNFALCLIPNINYIHENGDASVFLQFTGHLTSDFHFLCSTTIHFESRVYEQYITLTMRACYIECLLHLMLKRAKVWSSLLSTKILVSSIFLDLHIHVSSMEINCFIKVHKLTSKLHNLNDIPLYFLQFFLFHSLSIPILCLASINIAMFRNLLLFCKFSVVLSLTKERPVFDAIQHGPDHFFCQR